MSLQDAVFMARAIQLAKNGWYTTDPNPRVGCVLVKDDQIVSEGWHVEAGQAHAEIDALNKIESCEGATAYVTLEPCSHTGKTGPCCDALIAARVERVVVAMQDPNPLVAGRGIKKMQQAGIVVDYGLLQDQAEELNKGFIKRMVMGKPYLRSKIAMSLDGRTAMANGESQWITSGQSRSDVQILRAESSAVLTGINTVLADDPSLNVRISDIDGQKQAIKQPVRGVWDSFLNMPVQAKMLSLAGETWIITGHDDPQKIKSLEIAGAKVFQLKQNEQGRLDLNEVMLLLGRMEINSVLVESGAILNGSLLAANLVDQWLIYMAPCVLGDQGRGVFHIPGMQGMSDKMQLDLAELRQIGPDIKMIFNNEKK